MSGNALVDVVVVSYNSRAYLRSCVWASATSTTANVIVVDNASTDGSLDAVADLESRRSRCEDNRGFAHGCNVGMAAGKAPYVLL